MADRPTLARSSFVKGLSAAVVACALTLSGTAAVAVDPAEKLADPALEDRARQISKDLRCLVCQNQSIDDSDAELARDLRVLVRERITAGDSNGEVVDYVVSRYGDFVLLRPPFKPETYALWFGPAGLVLIALVVLAVYYRRSKGSSEPAPLSAAEEERLNRVMRDPNP